MEENKSIIEMCGGYKRYNLKNDYFSFIQITCGEFCDEVLPFYVKIIIMSDDKYETSLKAFPNFEQMKFKVENLVKFLNEHNYTHEWAQKDMPVKCKTTEGGVF